MRPGSPSGCPDGGDVGPHLSTQSIHKAFRTGRHMQAQAPRPLPYHTCGQMPSLLSHLGSIHHLPVRSGPCKQLRQGRVPQPRRRWRRGGRGGGGCSGCTACQHRQPELHGQGSTAGINWAALCMALGNPVWRWWCGGGYQRVERRGGEEITGKKGGKMKIPVQGQVSNGGEGPRPP